MFFPPLSCCCKSLVCFGMCHFLFFLRDQWCWVREGQLTQLWDFISGKFQDHSPASSVRVHLSSRRQPLLLQLSGNTQSSFIFAPLALPVRATQQPRCFSYCYSTEGFFYPLDLSQRLWRYRDVEYIPRRSDDSKTQDGMLAANPERTVASSPQPTLYHSVGSSMQNRETGWGSERTHKHTHSAFPCILISAVPHERLAWDGRQVQSEPWHQFCRLMIRISVVMCLIMPLPSYNVFAMFDHEL